MHGIENTGISFRKLFTPLTTTKVCLILFIIGFFVYANMLFNGFVWDDTSFILLNPDVKTLSLAHLFGTNMFNDVVYYRPLPALYFSVLYSLFSVNAFPYHLFQLILHISCVVLFYIFLTNFFHKYLSFFLSLIFLVHPIQIESVSYIAQTVSPLFFFFGISSLLIFIKKTSLKYLIIIHVFLLLTILTKETGVIFLLLLNIYNFLYRKAAKIKLLIFGLITLCVYFAIRFGVGHVFFMKSLLIAPIARVSLFERVLTIPAILFYYLKTFFFPSQLGILQDWVVTSAKFDNFYLPLIIDISFIIFIIVIGIYLRLTDRKIVNKFLFFTFVFLLGLSFHLQIAPLDMTVADRWFYLPMAGLLGMLAVILQTFIFPIHRIKKIMYVLFIFLILILSARTMIRNTNWYDEITLFTHDIKVHDNFDLEDLLAAAYGERHDYINALKHSRKSIEFYPYDMNYFNLALTYDLTGDVENAKKYYYTTLNAPSYSGESHKHNYPIYERMGLFLLHYETPAATSEFLKKTALTDYPESWYLYLLLAISENNLQNQKEALFAAEKAKDLSLNDQTNYVYTQIENNQPIEIEKAIVVSRH